MSKATTFKGRPQDPSDRAISSRMPSPESRLCGLLSGRGPLPTWLFIDRYDVQYCARRMRRHGEIPTDEMADRIVKNLSRLLHNPSSQPAERVCRISDLALSDADLRKLRKAIRSRVESLDSPRV